MDLIDLLRSDHRVEGLVSEELEEQLARALHALNHVGLAAHLEAAGDGGAHKLQLGGRTHVEGDLNRVDGRRRRVELEARLKGGGGERRSWKVVEGRGRSWKGVEGRGRAWNGGRREMGHLEGAKVSGRSRKVVGGHRRGSSPGGASGGL